MMRSNRVDPAGQDNEAFEMTDGVFNQSESQSVRPVVSMTSVASAMPGVVQQGSYTCGRWRRAVCTSTDPTGKTKEKYRGLVRDDDIDGSDPDPSKRLLDHFRELAKSEQDTDEVDLPYLDSVIRDGADVNTADKYGQTALHEISRAWNVDVMRFFLDRGADVRRGDAFGVTPLHVAAALDYGEMVHFLLEKQVDIGARTSRDQQTPLHYAAKNDAIGAIRVLVRSGADIAAGDYKRRTPLQLAANLDRSEAARALMELGADARVGDSDGQLCITPMIGRMAPMAQLALNQFHVTDRMTRQQFYYLQDLEPEPPSKQGHMTPSAPESITNEPTSPLECIVRLEKLDLIMHPVILKLIAVKWNLYGRRGAWILLLLNFLFIVSWTTVAISVSVTRDEERPYVFPGDWWRVLLVVVALGLTVEELFREGMELLRSCRKLRSWQRWSERRINQDLLCAHPMWPEEKHFFEEQIKLMRSRKPFYFHDLWNVFDWLVYTLVTVAFGIHVADIFVIESTLRVYSLRLFAVAVIFLWLRLMKHVRAFRMMGPFIVMLGKIMGDVFRFLFLYVEIFIPYACAFWIIFGGTSAVPSMRTVPQLLYSLYRLTLVDDYEFDAMVGVDSSMAPLLCGSFLALSAVLCMNVLIALLSDTLQRVHGNALANAVMQQASVILRVEESMRRLRGYSDRQHIQRHCAPLVEFYDEEVATSPDQHAEMRKISEHIKETLDEFLDMNKKAGLLNPCKSGSQETGAGGGGKSVAAQGELLRTLQEVQNQQKQQTHDLSALRADLRQLQVLLQQLVHSAPAVGPDHDAPPKEFTELGDSMS